MAMLTVSVAPSPAAISTESAGVLSQPTAERSSAMPGVASIAMARVTASSPLFLTERSCVPSEPGVPARSTSPGVTEKLTLARAGAPNPAPSTATRTSPNAIRHPRCPVIDRTSPG